MCQQAGIYWVTLIDQFAASWVLLFLTLLEIIGVCYIYGKHSCLEAMAAAAAAAVTFSPHASAGGNRFIEDIEMMLGKKSCLFWLWWRACWFCISPCIIVVSKTCDVNEILCPYFFTPKK